MKWRRVRWVGGVLVAAAVIAFIAAELSVRKRFYERNRADPALTNMLFYSTDVQRVPGKTIVFRFYGANAKVLADAEIRLNNHGFMSRRDYSYEKQRGELRIVVLGGEQTASSVSSISWPDHLEDRMRGCFPGRNIRVLNLGWPDAGPRELLETWRNEGHKYRPDIVLLNMIENDFLRGANANPKMPRTSGTLARIGGKPIAYSPLEFRFGEGEDDVARIPSVVHAKGVAFESLRSPAAVPNRPYGIWASAKFIRNTAHVAALQRQIVEDMIAGVRPCFGCLIVRRVSRGDAPNVASMRNFDPVPATPVTDSLYFELGGETLLGLIRALPRPVLIHNFHYFEWFQRLEYSYTKAFLKAHPELKIEDMRTRLPVDASEAMVRSWYMHPFMTEKWNDRGHRIYADLVAEFLSERIAGRKQNGCKARLDIS